MEKSIEGGWNDNDRSTISTSRARDKQNDQDQERNRGKGKLVKISVKCRIFPPKMELPQQFPFERKAERERERGRGGKRPIRPISPGEIESARRRTKRDLPHGEAYVWNRRRVGEGEGKEGGDRIVATGNVSCWMEARHARTRARTALVCASFGFIRSLTHARARARARAGRSLVYTE